MEFFETLLNQKQTIRFEYSPIGQERIQMLLAAAQLAPFSGEVQPYELVVIHSKELLVKAAELLNWGEISNCSALVVLLVDLEASSGLRDTAIAAHQLCLAAGALGYGVTQLSKGIQKLRDLIELKGDDFEIAQVIAIGKPAETRSLPRGKSLKDLGHENKVGSRFSF